MSSPFQFKQFKIHQDQAAMKVGTDGVLLGAWTQISDTVNSILDIGSGTGLISLMMAQRSYVENIDAVELNEELIFKLLRILNKVIGEIDYFVIMRHFRNLRMKLKKNMI